ncbi:MAG: intein-containing RctB family protein [Candidatus Diapherotrites archaeon]|nr:intein-containing RctB family protein [Candidatus Diapherotrites archaeon]
MKIEETEKFVWEIEPFGDMRVPGRIYADDEIMEHLKEDLVKEWNALQQVINVASLPGIQKYSLAMSDVHPGYGFPIGGVGAFDTKEGMIMVGGVGFDVNCLSGDTKVLHEHGYTRPIKSFKKDFNKQRIKCVNPHTAVKNTGIGAFMEFKPRARVLKVVTESGREIIATEDHPFLTPGGMKELKEITSGEISVYPFEGVKYGEPPEFSVVTEKDVKRLPLEKDMKPTIQELEKRGLLPLKPTSEKFPYLLKVMGFVLGDGGIYFIKNKGTVWFYGEKEDLEKIREDVKKIGFTPSRVYSRERSHEINTNYGKVKFSHNEKSFKTTSSAFAALLWAMGVPTGNKARQDWGVPKWLFKCPKWQKRLFLAAFFGAELTTPSAVSGHGFNIASPILSVNKKDGFAKSGRKFLESIAMLLKEFGVESSIIAEEKKSYTNKEGEASTRLRLQVSSKPKNLIRFWSRVGYEYNQKKAFLANAAVQYLMLKQRVIREREAAIKKARKMKTRNTPTQIYNALVSKHVNKRFLERSLYEERKTPPRTPNAFPIFNDFVKEKTRGLGNTGQVWDRIEKKEAVDYIGRVYDFTVSDENHNFIANSFVVSNCGVRVMKAPLTKKDIEGKKKELAQALFDRVPAGLGSTGDLRLTEAQIDEVLVEGAKYAVENGYGIESDLEYTEEEGRIAGALPEAVSHKAKQRQFKQVGTLGSGNHYLEVQYVDEVFDEKAAKAFGLEKGQVMVAIHCGSRALGHQVGTDYLQTLDNAMKKYGIKIRERELVGAPFESEEGQQYFGAVNGASNVAFANRQVIAHLARQVFVKVFGIGEEEFTQLYDIGHNTAKLEEHGGKKLIVHRKGATRAFGPGHKEVPKAYRSVGQPVLIGGTMGTCSYILHGTETGMKETFGSSCHGAGRRMSRAQAKKKWWGETVQQELATKGIIVLGHSKSGLAEEAPGAYKDVNEVVGVMHETDIARKVVKALPMVNVKG